MNARDPRPATGCRWRRWLRQILAWGVTELEHIGRLYAIPAPADAAAAAGVTLPGLPGHPERPATGIPPSPVELALWRDLGWPGAPDRTPDR